MTGEEKQIHDRDCLFGGHDHEGGCFDCLTGYRPVYPLEAGGPIPNVVSARMVIEFADGRVCVFEAKDPAPSFVQIEHVPHDRILDQEQPVYPELIDDMVLYGPVAEILLRIRASRGQSLRYLKAE